MMDEAESVNYWNRHEKNDKQLTSLLETYCHAHQVAVNNENHAEYQEMINKKRMACKEMIEKCYRKVHCLTTNHSARNQFNCCRVTREHETTNTQQFVNNNITKNDHFLV